MSCQWRLILLGSVRRGQEDEAPMWGASFQLMCMETHIIRVPSCEVKKVRPPWEPRLLLFILYGDSFDEGPSEGTIII